MNIDKYRVAANITEYHIKINILKNHHSKTNDVRQLLHIKDVGM